jgi:hypothetical protein
MLTVEGSGLGAVRVTELSRCRYAEAAVPVPAA